MIVFTLLLSSKFIFFTRKKFGSLFYKNSISLGTWNRIIEDFKSPLSDKELNEFKDLLRTKLDDDSLKVILDACEILVAERNPVSHTKTLTINEVISLRTKIIEIINNVIDILY